MGILQGLERRLQGAVDKTFARIFGGSVQPAEVSTALAHEAAARSTTQSGRTIAPNRYVVELGPSDAADVGEDLRRVSSAFSAMLATYIREQGWETYADVDVTLRESERLHTGQFRVSSLIDPSVGAPTAGISYDGQRQPSQGAPNRYGYPDLGDAPSIPAGAGTGAPRNPNTPGPGPGARIQQSPGAWSYPGPQGSHPDHYDGPRQPQAGGASYLNTPAVSYPNTPSHPGQPAYSNPAYDAPHPHDPMPYPNEYQQHGPRLVVDDGTGRSYLLQRGQNVVGRGQHAALRLADTSVSREHIDVYFDGRVAVVHDLGSTNGTTVNGSAIQTWQLADGDVIRLGQSTVVYSAR